MRHWKRTRSALEWGTFFGVCTWLLASGITNKLTGLQVWTLVLSRTLMGLGIALWKPRLPWWARGLVVGAGVNLPLGVIVNGWPDFGGGLGLGTMMGTGLLIGYLIEVALRRRERELALLESGKK